MGWQTLVVQQLQAGNTIINLNGMFLYSSAPAAGNLVYSASPNTSTFNDQFGNHCVPLTGWYDNVGGFFTQIGAGFITFGTGSLSTGWTANTTMEDDGSGDLLLVALAQVQMSGSGAGPSWNGTTITVP